MNIADKITAIKNGKSEILGSTVIKALTPLSKKIDGQWVNPWYDDKTVIEMDDVTMAFEVILNSKNKVFNRQAQAVINYKIDYSILSRQLACAIINYTKLNGGVSNFSDFEYAIESLEVNASVELVRQSLVFLSESNFKGKLFVEFKSGLDNIYFKRDIPEEVESNSKNDLIPANIPMANIEVKRDVYHTIVNTEIDFKIVTSGGEVKMDDYLSLSLTSYRDAMEIAYNNKSLNRGKEYKISKQSSEFTDSSEFITYLITEVQTDTTKTIELSKPVCNIMVGYPSCGKSTYIAENLKGYTVIGFDSTLESLLNQEGNKTYDALQYQYQGMTINEKKGITGITKLNFISALEADKNIVVDQTNLTNKDRLKWFKIVQEIAPHYIINFIEFTTPLDVCVSRKRHGKTIPIDVYERMCNMREYINLDITPYTTHLKIDSSTEVQMT